MNEPIFKNVFIRDEETLKEFYKHDYLKATRFRIIYIGYAILLLMSVLAYDISLFISYLLLGLILALIILFSYSQNLKTTIARDKELANGRDIVSQISVFDDRIELTVLENTQSVSFENVKRADQTKNYICVITKARFAYIFKKDSFTKGDSEGFIEFLRFKGIKVRK